MKRLAIFIALGAATTPYWLAAQDTPEKGLTFFKGKVVALADHLAKQGIKLDADAGPYGRVLVAEDGKVYTLVKDAGARMFFQDAKLLDRPMRLTGKLVPGSTLLQVINVHSYLGGKLHEVYYWCDICTIRGYEFGICDCCGDMMVRKETPVK